MLVYLEYFVTWVFFMAIIAAIAIVCPRLARFIDKRRKKYKPKHTDKLFEFPSAEEIKRETEADETSEKE